MTAPLISAIMPAYNSRAYIRDAIDSILNQTEQDFELIIINDGSTDDTEAIVRSYDSAKIRYYANLKNLGIPRTYNRALDLARGEFIAISEHDDISHPQRLEIQTDYLQRHPHVGGIGTEIEGVSNKRPAFKSIDIRKVKLKFSSEELMSRAIFSLSPIHNASGMIRTAVLTKHNITFDTSFRIVSDADLYQRIHQVTDLVRLDCVLLRHRRHADNASGDPAEFSREISKLREHFYSNTFGVDIRGIMCGHNRMKNLAQFNPLTVAIEKIVRDKIDDPKYDAAVLRERQKSFLFRALCASPDPVKKVRLRNYGAIYATYKNSNLSQQLDIARKLYLHIGYLLFRIAALKRTTARDKT